MTVVIRNIQFQVLHEARGKTRAIIAQRPGARNPQFELLTGSCLIFQAGTQREITSIFANEPGNVLSDELGVGKNTISNIRAALGIANEYTGESRTTRWRRGDKPIII